MEQLEKLEQAVGQFVLNSKGETIGCITEITRNAKNMPEYIILSSDQFFGRGNRYFAIPAYPASMEIDKEGKIILTVEPDDLVLARGISFDRCPTIKENSFFQMIYEVYGYNEPSIATRQKTVV